MANIRRYRSRVVHLPLDEDRGTIEDNTAAFLENVREVATEDHVEWVVVAQMDDFVTTRKYNDDRLADTLTIYETNSVAVVCVAHMHLETKLILTESAQQVFPLVNVRIK